MFVAALAVFLGGAPTPIKDSVGDLLDEETVGNDFFFVEGDTLVLGALEKILRVGERFGVVDLGCLVEADLLVSGVLLNRFSVGDRFGCGGDVFEEGVSSPFKLGFVDGDGAEKKENIVLLVPLGVFTSPFFFSDAALAVFASSAAF